MLINVEGYHLTRQQTVARYIYSGLSYILIVEKDQYYKIF